MFEKVHLDLAKYMQNTGLPMKITVLTPLFIYLPLVYPKLTRLDFSIFQTFQRYHLRKICTREKNNNIILDRKKFSYQSNLHMLFFPQRGEC